MKISSDKFGRNLRGLSVYLSKESNAVSSFVKEDAKLIRSFDVDGCRRRRGQPGRGPPRFRCNGQSGPPCTIKRGDTVYLDVEFAPGY